MQLTDLGSNSGETTFRVRSKDETTLVFDLFKGGPEDTILIIPGFWRTRRHPVMRAIAMSLQDVGATVCLADNRGHGDSRGTFGFDTREPGDVDAIVTRLEAMGLAAEGVCLMGFSAGGAIAISAAADDPRLIRGLVLVSAVADFKRVCPRPNPFALHRQLSLRSALQPPRFWWYERSRRQPLADAGEITVPTCLIHARNDWLVHHSHSLRIARQLGKSPEVHILDAERAHAERMFVGSDEPSRIAALFLQRTLGMNLSGR